MEGRVIIRKQHQDNLPDIVLIIEGNGDLCIFGNGSDRIYAQVNHPICNHMTNLQYKSSTANTLQPGIGLTAKVNISHNCKNQLLQWLVTPEEQDYPHKKCT